VPGWAVVMLVPKLTELEKDYKPFPLLANRHVETVFAAFFRSLPKLTFRRECVRMADGGTVALDWPLPEVTNPKAVLVLLVCLLHLLLPEFSTISPKIVDDWRLGGISVLV